MSLTKTIKRISLNNEDKFALELESILKDKNLSLNEQFTYVFSFNMDKGFFVKLEIIEKSNLSSFCQNKFFSRNKRLFLQKNENSYSYYIQTPFYKKSVKVSDNKNEVLFFQTLNQ